MVGSGFRRYRSVQSISGKPHPPHPTPADTTQGTPMFDDTLPVELLELVRTFRKTVEGAIMGADKGVHRSLDDDDPPPRTNLQLSPFAGSELSHACTDLIRYVAQLLKHKKDEYDELFLKHRHWKRAPQSPLEEARARTVGPMVLTSLYGMAESLLSVTGADRAIVYMHNPNREELVGIVYGGGSGDNVMEVPITLKASRADVLLALASSAAAGTGTSLSSCGVPKRSPIDPVVLAFSLDAGVNIGDMEAAKSVEEVRKGGMVSSIRYRSGTNSGAGRADVSVEPHGPLSGYTVHNMLCIPISLPQSMWGHSTVRDGKSKTIGVLQLLNKLKHTPSVNASSAGASPQFTAVDEGFAHHTSLSMGSLLRWGTQGVTCSNNDLDFLSLESRRLSVDLQRLSHAERVRCRDHDGATALKLAGATPKGGGSKPLTHSESTSLKRHQAASNELNGATHRHFVVGEILDNVTKEVEKQKATHLIPKLPSVPGPKLELREAISLTNSIFSASPLPRRHGPLLIHRVAHTDDASSVGPIESGVVLGTGDICAHVVGASQAMGHLRDAWAFAHHSSQELEVRVKHLEDSLANEKQQRRKLELFIQQSGLVVPPSFSSATPSHRTKEDTSAELPSNLDFLQARIKQLKSHKSDLLEDCQCKKQPAP